MRNIINYLSNEQVFYPEGAYLSKEPVKPLKERDLVYQALAEPAEREVVEVHNSEGDLMYLAEIVWIDMESKLVQADKFEYWF